MVVPCTWVAFGSCVTNISETTVDRGLFIIGSLQESGHAESNGDVTDDVT